MCLFIQYLPKSKRDSNCVPCLKGYDINYTGRAVTPYKRAFIPPTGILKTCTIAKQRGLWEEIHGGAIHALCEKKYISTHKLAKAYAFGVMAYGNDNDLACSLLYIPSLDKTRERSAKMKQINLWMKQEKGPTNTEVKRLFPEFVAPEP